MAYVVVFAGEYNFANKSGLRKELRRHYSAQDLVLDMSAVTLIEPGFISELMLLVRARWKTGHSPVTVVLQPNSATREPFEKTGITNVAWVLDSYSKDGLAPSLIEYVDGKHRIAKVCQNSIRRVLAVWRSIRSGVAVALKPGT